MLTGKDHSGVFEAMRKNVNASWIFIDTHGDRAQSAVQLKEAMPGSEGICVAYEDLKSTLLEITEPGDVILGFGSFSTVETLGQLVHA